MSSDSKIEVREVPRLGSTKETLALMATVMKESLQFRKRLGGESTRFFFRTIWPGIRHRGKARDFIRGGEHAMSLPDMVSAGEKYWGFRYGEPVHKVGRLATIPLGYTLLNDDNSLLTDRKLSCQVAKLFRIWEEIYIRPYRIPKTPVILNWLIEFENKFYEAILTRKKSGYDSLGGTSEELEALRELDQEVIDFHEARIEMLVLENKLHETQFELFEHPSDSNISDFMQTTYRFKQLANLENEYLQRRD